MRAKVKKVKVSAGNDADIAGMFNQMLGTGTCAITHPKFLKIKAGCIAFIRMVGMLSSSPFMSHSPMFTKQVGELNSFCQQVHANMDTIFPPSHDTYPTDDEAFGAVYANMRKSPLIATMVKVCDNLAVYKKNYSDVHALSHKFIILMPGVDWTPFPFTTLNLKFIINLPDVQENTIRFFMIILFKSFSITHGIWEELNSPDIDINQFVEVIMSSLDNIQNRPELHRCKKAFAKIRESIELLKTRFNGYYKDFLSTNDTTIIMQHFILDVSKETTADPQVTVQFRTIIN